MNKKLVLLFIIALFTILVSTFGVAAQKNPKATGHLVRDTFDHMWDCLGSPSNCNF